MAKSRKTARRNRRRGLQNATLRPVTSSQVPSERNESNEQPNAKTAKEQPERKPQRDRNRYMEFFFESAYQVVTWIGIALSIMFIGLFYSQQNWRGVLWSSCALVCLAVIMLCLLAQRFFPAFRMSGSFSPPATQEDINDINRKLDEFFASLKLKLLLPEKQITQKSPGISLHTVLRVHRLAEKRRKYLYEFGGTDKGGRFSLYFDSQDVFTFALIDAHAESYNIRLSATDVPFEQFFYLACEVALEDRQTELRVLINGNQVGMLTLPFSVNFDLQRILTEGVMGADINGNNGAQFDSAETVVYSQTLTTLEAQKLIQYFSTKAHDKFVQFGGTQWLRRGDKGFYQDLPDAKPIFRNLEESKDPN